MENPNKINEGLVKQKQDVTAQVSQLKNAAMGTTAQQKQIAIDPAISKQQDLDTLSMGQYQEKYGYNSVTTGEYANNKFKTIVDPAFKQKQLEETADSHDTVDLVRDVGLGVAAGAVDLVGSGAGFGLAVGSNPIGVLTEGGDFIASEVSKFVGKSDEYQETKDNIKKNVNEFLSEYNLGDGEVISDEVKAIKDGPKIIQDIVNSKSELLSDAAGLVFQGTKVVSDWIRSGQTEALRAKSQLRLEENQKNKANLKELLGEDSTAFEHALVNTEIGFDAFVNLLVDPSATAVVIAESIPSLVGAGSIAKSASKTAHKNASAKITDSIYAENLSHVNTKNLIDLKLRESADILAEASEKGAKTSFIAASGGFEGAGAASESYNLIIGTDTDTLNKTSKRYQELVKTMSPREARKKLAIESALGAGSGVMMLASGISRIAQTHTEVNRASGVVKTADGFIPRGLQVAQGAFKEGAEELFQSFIGSAATGIVKRDNIDSEFDVYADASIAAGEGTLAGVGTSAVISAGSEIAKKLANGVTKVNDTANSAEVASSIRDDGLTPGHLDTTDETFDYRGTMRGIQARNNTEGVTKEERATNFNEAITATAEYAARIQSTQEYIATNPDNKSPEELVEAQKQVDKDSKALANGQNFLASLRHDYMQEFGADPINDIPKAVEGDKEATERVMGNMRSAPESITIKQSQDLLDSETLSPEDTELVKAHIQYRTDVKNMDEVSTDVYSGSKGFVGIRQYMSGIASQIALGRPEQAQGTLDKLSAFASRHIEKANDFQEGFHIASLGKEATPEQRAKLESINIKYPNSNPKFKTIHAGSTSLVERTKLEANSLQSAVEMATVQLSKPSNEVNETSTPTEPESVQEETVEVPPSTTETLTEEESIPNMTDEELQSIIDNDPVTNEDGVGEAFQEVESRNEIKEVTIKPVKSEVSIEQQIESALEDGDTSRAAELTNELETETFNLNDELYLKDEDNTAKVDGEFVASATPKDRLEQFKTENLFQKYFKPKNKGGSNPLVAVRDFMAVLARDTGKMVTKFTKTETVSERQEALVNLLTTHHNDFSKELNGVFKNLENTPHNFLNQDMIQFLTVDGALPENVVAALSVAGYNWLSTSAGDTIFNSFQDIGRIVGERNDDFIPTDLQRDELKQGSVARKVIQDMGRNAMTILGMGVDPNAPGNMKSQMENSMGMLALHTMANQGYLDIKKVPTLAMQSGDALTRAYELIKKYGSDPKVIRTKYLKHSNETVRTEAAELYSIVNTTTDFVVAANVETDSFPELNPLLKEYSESIKNTDQLLNKMFNSEVIQTGPTTEPDNNVDKLVRNTDQVIPEKYRDIIRKHQAGKHYIKTDQLDVLQAMSEDAQREMLGFVKDLSVIHDKRLDSVKGANRDISYSIEHMNNHINSLADGSSPFYFKHSVIKNGRLLLDSNTFNPQGDKLHRHLTKIEGQESTIEFNGDPVKLFNFKVALGQSMGISIDKMLEADSVALVDHMIEKEWFQEAIKAINSKDGDFTTEQETILLNAIKEGGEKAWSLDGLTAYAGYVKAKDSGQDSYTHDLMVEADGITNGPAIATLQFGIGTTNDDVIERLRKVGIKANGSTQEYGEWISTTGNRDNYENITLLLNDSIKDLSGRDLNIANFSTFLLKDLITKDKNGNIIKINRNISKNPLMTTIYGAGAQSIKDSLGYQAIAEIYKMLEEHRNNPVMLDALNKQLTGTFGLSLDLTQDPLTITLSAQQEAIIVKSVGDVFGTAMLEAIDTAYGQFKEGTQVINGAMGRVAETFQMMFEHAVEVKTQEMIADGKLAAGTTGPLETLPEVELRKILNDLRSSQPIMDSVLSAGLNKPEEGLYVGKTSENTNHKQVGLTTRQEHNNRPDASSTVRSGIKTYISGGASPVVTAVQNVDATTMLLHLADKFSFNVYDAIISGVDNISEHTENMNKHFYEINRDHDIAKVALVAFQRAELAAQEYDRKNGTNFRKEFNKVEYKKINGETTIVNIKSDLDSIFKEISKNKARTMGLITGVGQYGWENSTHFVNEPLVITIPDLVDASERDMGSGTQSTDQEFHTEEEHLINSMTVMDVFDELGSVGNVVEDASHVVFLRNSVAALKSQLTEPLKLHLGNILGDTMANIKGSDIYMFTQMFGGQPGSSAIANSGLRMSAQEALVHELWHAVSRHGVEANSLAKKEMEKRWEQAKDVITPYDLMDDPTLGENSPEFEQAQDTWNYIFESKTVKTTTETDPVSGETYTKEYSNHLHEFAAFSMTNAKFIAALKKVPESNSTKLTKSEVKDDADIITKFAASVYDAIVSVLSKVVDVLSTHLVNTRGKTTDVAVRELVKQLANIEAQNKNLLLSVIDSANRNLGKGADLISTIAQKVASPIVKLANAKIVKDSKQLLVRFPGRVVRLASQTEYVGMAINSINNARSNMKSSRQGFIEEMLTEANGLTDDNKKFHTLSRLKTKLIDSAVVHTITGVSKLLIKQFGNTQPSKLESAAITKVFLKGDLSTLDKSMTDLVDLLEDPSKVQAEIDALLLTLQGNPNYNHYLLQSKALAYYMVTGKNTSPNLNFNATQIARMFGSTKVISSNQTTIDTIDKIVSLMAMNYSSPVHKGRLAEFIKKSELTGTENGMTFIQEFHKQQKSDDLKNVFQGSETNVTKGHVREQYDPNIKMVVLTELEGMLYEKRGWVKGKELPVDPANPSAPKMFTYIDRHGGDTQTVAGIISLTSLQAKGTDTIKIRQSMGDSAPVFGGKSDAARIHAVKASLMQSSVARAGTFDPTKAGQHMAPLYNLSGDITGYRYMMTELTKDTLMNRNNDVISTIANGVASTINKVNSMELNKRTIQALRDEFMANPNKGGYIEFGPGSMDNEIKELYRTMPKQARMDIEAIWGTNNMLVDRQLLTLLFGYRKYSLADALAQGKDNKNIALQALRMIADTVGKPFGFSGEQVVRSVGTYWQEFVKEVKDFIVIKTGIVTLVNGISNSVQLKLAGLSLVDTLKYQKEGTVEVLKYQKNMAELFELEKIVELGLEPTRLGKNKSRIAQLKHSIATNPITDVIDDGLLQSIVEDVSVIEDEFSKKAKLTEAVDKYILNRVPGFVRTVVRNAYMTHDSLMYKKFSQAAQLSDFVARYALYKHNTKNGMSRDDAANQSLSTFINYDLPTHKSIQYLNDMGLLWFTKYYIRIQKILAKTLSKNPVGVLSIVTLDFMTGDAISTVYDSVLSPENVMNRVRLPDNPVDMLSNTALGQIL